MSEPLITLVLPYYNEADYLPATLASLAAQSDRRFRLVLVDNNSTDSSAGLARDGSAAMPDIGVEFLTEAQPGKIFALRTGIASVRTPWLATLDADTIYPPNYVARILREVAAQPPAVCVLAFGLPAGAPETASSRLRFYADFLPRKCHTGGYGQAFNTAALAEAGGFDPQRWPFVLEDHEIIHRMLGQGTLAYAIDHVCYPSDRRSDRSDCSWTVLERVLYKLMPQRWMDWFFYSFLAQRFSRRGLSNIKLRDQQWQSGGQAS